MASDYQLIERWISGDEYSRDRRDLWLLAPTGQWMTRWAVDYRRGGIGHPVSRVTYDDEQAARWALAARMEQCRNEVPPAEWVQV